MTSSLLDGLRPAERSLARPLCPSTLSPKRAWQLLLALVQRIRTHGPVLGPVGVGLDVDDRWVELPVEFQDSGDVQAVTGVAWHHPAGAAWGQLVLYLCVFPE